MALETRYDGMFSGDIRNAMTADGILIVDVWAQAQDFRARYNELRNTQLGFMGYVTTNPLADRVAQVTAQWMRMSEHGTPDAMTKVSYDIAVTTGLEGYEAATGYTDWFTQVVPSSGSLLANVVSAIFVADFRRRYLDMWQQFFRSTNRNAPDILYNLAVNVVPFYNGDSQVPPTVGTKTFSTAHNHFLRTANTGVITAADLETGLDTVLEHGFNLRPIIFGSQATVNKIMALGDPDVAKDVVISPWVSPDAVNVNQPGVLINVASQVNSLFIRQGVFRGKAEIMVARDVPDNYIGFFSQQGQFSPENPLQVREPNDAQLQGVQVVRKTDYPFVEEYYRDIYGIGVRQRGNGAAMQHTWSGGSAYQDPAWTYSATIGG